MSDLPRWVLELDKQFLKTVNPHLWPIDAMLHFVRPPGWVGGVPPLKGVGMKEWLAGKDAFNKRHSRGWNIGVTYDEVVVAYGIYNSIDPLTPAEAKVAKAAMGRRRWEAKQCYPNGQELVRRDKTGTLVYHEGYAMSAMGIAIAHGWVTINNKVVDVTWGPGNFGTEYFGVPITRFRSHDRLVSQIEMAIVESQPDFPTF